MAKVLLIGFGNPGRLDDGLGPRLAEAIKLMDLDGIDVDSDYQLTVEDSVDMAEHDIIIFADASVNGPEPFYFKKIKASTYADFTTHSISPESLLCLTKELFNKELKAYILGIRGYEFNDFREQLSEKATNNLNKAIDFVKEILVSSNFHEVRTSLLDNSVAGNKSKN